MPRLTMKQVKAKLLPEDLLNKKYDGLRKDIRTSHLFSPNSTTSAQFARDLKKRYNALMKIENPKISLTQLRNFSLEPHM
eukprot:1740568-Pleurochrysis_carterae.AAC.1